LTHTLITGATGLVGSELAERLRSTGPARRLFLCARPGELGRADPTGIGEIVHCAADTRFDRPREEAMAANAGGTRAVLDFAHRCPRLKRVVHVSTAFVCGRREGVIPEAPLEPGHQFVNTYQESKYEAERLVIAEMPRLPVSIVRISSIIGDSRTGEVRRINHVHQLLKLVTRAPLPVMPYRGEAPVDLVPLDWVTESLARILDGLEPGRVYHLCAGQGHSLALEALLDLLPALFAPRAVVYPRRVSLKEYDQFAAGASTALQKEVIRVLGYFLPHLGMNQVFAVDRTHPLTGTPPDPRLTLERVVRYSIAANWGRRDSCC